MSRRRLANWIEGFVEYTEGIRSCEMFRIWTSVAGIAGAMGRKTTVRIEGQEQLSNMYIIFVAGGGIGKSNSLKIMHALMGEIMTIHLSSNQLTQRAFYNELQEASGTVNIGVDKFYQHHSLCAIIPELSTFLPADGGAFMEALSDIYDHNPTFIYKTAHSGTNRIDYPCLTLIGGITTKNLGKRFTDVTLDQGFPSRCVLVYSNDKIKVPLFSGVNNEETIEAKAKLRTDLVHDLEMIHTLKGSFTWDKDAARDFEAWVDSGMEPVPQDLRFEQYNNRRIAHITKLSMIMSAAKRDDLIITPEDYNEAKDLLLKTEIPMPNAVEGIARNKGYDATLRATKFVEHWWKRNEKPCPEMKVRRAISTEVADNMMGYAIDNLIEAGYVKLHSGSKPHRLLIPMTKH